MIMPGACSHRTEPSPSRAGWRRESPRADRGLPASRPPELRARQVKDVKEREVVRARQAQATMARRARLRGSGPEVLHRLPGYFSLNFTSPAVDTIVKESVDNHPEQERLYGPTTIPS